MTSASDDEMMVRYIEGAATDQEVASLELRLAHDQALRREFVRLAHLQALFLDLPRPAVPTVRPHARRRAWTFSALGVAAAALVAVALVTFVGPTAEMPTITVLSGRVACIHGHAPVQLHVGDRLEAGDHLTLGAHADLAMAWKDHSVVHVYDPGELTMTATSTSMLTLSAGELVANITHDPHRPFRIATPDGVVTDIGTSFTIHCDHTGTSVSVDSGVVAFANTAGEVTIMAGRTAASSAGQAPVLAPILPATSPAQAVAIVPPPAPVVAGPPQAFGTVTAVDQQRKSFTLKEDGTGLINEYRAYFAGGHPNEILAQIAQLKVGEHILVTYIDKEGRRVQTISR